MLLLLTLIYICSFSDIYILIFIVSGWVFFVIISSIYHNLFNGIICIEWIKNTFIASWIIMLLLLTLIYICSFSDIYILIFIVSGWFFFVIISSIYHNLFNCIIYIEWIKNTFIASWIIMLLLLTLFYICSFSDIYILIFIVSGWVFCHYQ